MTYESAAFWEKESEIFMKSKVSISKYEVTNIKSEDFDIKSEVLTWRLKLEFSDRKCEDSDIKSKVIDIKSELLT